MMSKEAADCDDLLLPFVWNWLPSMFLLGSQYYLIIFSLWLWS